MLVRAELVKEYIVFFKERLPEMLCLVGQTDYLPDLMESLGSIKDLNIRFNQDGTNINPQIISG